MQQRHHNPARSFENIFALRIGEPLSDKVFADPFADVFALAFSGSGRAATLSTLSSGARAAALLLRTFAVGLRALGLYTTAQLLHNSPLGRSLSSLRALAKSLPVSGFLLQTFWSAASARLESSRRFEAARSAPDWRPIPSLRSVIPQAASRARFALDQAPYQSRLGTLPPLSLVGTRSCLYRDRISQRWGASFTLRRLGAAYHGSPAPWGVRKLRSNREVLAAFAPVCWGNLRSASRRGLRALARKLAACSGKQRIVESVHGSQAFFNQQSNLIKE